MKFVMALCLAVLTSACASKKYKTFDTLSNFKTAGNLIQGKTPKESAQIIGAPMSAYFKEDKSVYYMVYPMSDNQVSMTDLMLNDRLECVALNFEKEKEFKFDGWQSTAPFTCAAIKGEKYDSSLID